MKSTTFQNKASSIIVIFVLIFSMQTVKAQLPKGYETHFYKGMRYGLFKPVNYTPQHKYPLVIYLHGSGDTVSWNFGWYNPPISIEDPCFVITPKSNIRNGGWGNSWNKEHSVDMKNTLEIMEVLIKEYNIDQNRLYINGTSMGGFGTFSVLAKEPGRFAGAYAVCGGGNPDEAENIKQTPLCIFHGDADPVVNVSNSRNIYNRIHGIGGNEVRYTEYPGVGHNSWENAGKEKLLTKWLFKQVKGIKHGMPALVEGLKVVSSANGKVELAWNPPSNPTNDNDVWYYKLFRNGTLIAQIDGTENTFSDPNPKDDKTFKYKMVAVNYFFKESEASKEVGVK